MPRNFVMNLNVFPFYSKYALSFYYCVLLRAILFFRDEISNHLGCNRVDRNETGGLRNYGTKVRRKIRIGEKVA